ncbi:HD-GYP domain-containing protein [Undibacterium fentianense]|uniref:HD-GYP domain-containing protein n=1 Tax=Undibacterium fentianense TaxID=2828728 RepID=A0A941IDX5_9BURK|nr:HD-GYP domain-containing protein [Undibacterium fentianense]MBR7801784.1 HD-GYP domain-containing protein [Undibacterium fentianense]
MAYKTHQLCEALRIRIDDLRLGMFIIELDRPWVQTPFMLQGFLLNEALDLTTLQGLVKELVIDPRRSNEHALVHLPVDLLYESPPVSHGATNSRKSLDRAPKDAEQQSNLERVVGWLHKKFIKTDYAAARRLRHHPKKTVHQHRSKVIAHAHSELGRFEQESFEQTIDTPVQVISKTQIGVTRRFAAMMQGMEPRDASLADLSWWARWLKWSEDGRHAHHSLWSRRKQNKLRSRRPEYIPEELHLVHYHDQRSMRDELVRAREVVERAGALIDKLHQDLRNMQSLELKEVLPTVQLLTDSVISNPSAMMWLLRMRSENMMVVSHALKVSVYMLTLGRHIGFSKEQLVELGFIGLLLDIGKLEMPEGLLAKPSRLSPAEASIIQKHVDASINLLEAQEPLSPNVKLGINQHHERMDGSGYPRGLAGAEISIFGRMAAIADSFAAMTSARPYGETRSSFDAMKELFRMAEGQLHAPLVEEFVQAIGIFPVGSLIQLTTGEVAIVLEHNKVRRLDPKVLILTKADKNLLEKPMMFDLMRQDLVEDAERISILRGLPDGAYGLICHDFYRA